MREKKKNPVQKPYDVPMPDLSTIFHHSSCQEKLVQNRPYELHLGGEIDTVCVCVGGGSGLFGPAYHQVLATLQTGEH